MQVARRRPGHKEHVGLQHRQNQKQWHMHMLTPGPQGDTLAMQRKRAQQQGALRLQQPAAHRCVLTCAPAPSSLPSRTPFHSCVPSFLHAHTEHMPFSSSFMNTTCANGSEYLVHSCVPPSRSPTRSNPNGDAELVSSSGSSSSGSQQH